MAPDNLTPEEKLLNIIEDPSVVKGNRFNANKAEKGSVKQIPTKILAFGKGNFFLQFFTLQNLNQVVVITGVFLAGFLVFDFQYQKVETTKRLLDIQPSQKQIDRWLKLKHSMGVSLKDSLNAAQRRNIFALTGTSLSSGGIEVKEDDWVIKATEAFKQLSLVGVLWEADCPQVMIEETQKGKTLFLRAGDMVDIFKVKTINENSVVLEKNNKEWVLR